MKLRKSFVVLLALTLVALAVRMVLLNSNEKRRQHDLRQRAAHSDLEAVMELLDRDPSVVNIRTETGSTPLLDAVAWGEMEHVREFLNHGADINAKGQHGWTPLHWVVLGGSVPSGAKKPLVQLFVTKGALINAKDDDGMTPLHHAAWSSDDEEYREIARILISHGADEDILAATLLGDLDRVNSLLDKNPALVESSYVSGGPRVLFWAALEDKYDAAKLLIARGADVNARATNGLTALHGAVDGGDKEIVLLLLDNGASVNAKDKDGNTPLLKAAGGRDYMIELFVVRGADVNARDHNGETALHKAQNSIAVKILLANEADPKAADKQGVTPLHRAAASMESAQILVDRGADVKVCDKQGRTPLHYAAAFGAVEVTRLLLQKGADVNVHDIDGWTPLHCALGGFKPKVESIALENEEAYPPGSLRPFHQHDGIHGEIFNCYPEIIKILLACGADPNAKDKDGMAPLDWAIRVKSSNGCQDATELLRKASAKK